MDADGEYAGFKLSGHLLRNESILNPVDPEFGYLPHMLTQPLGVIQARAIRPLCLRGSWLRLRHSIPPTALPCERHAGGQRATPP